MVDGLIIPRTYNDYFSRSDPAAIRQLVAQFTDAALSASSENPVQNKVVKAALDVINAVIPAGASANDKLALKSSVDAIDAKIPTQASAQNQLADKDFVNSSISTNTANYISDNGEPFASVAALEAYSGTVTNNDYAFVTGTDAAGNVYYDRYKATVSGASVSWAKEYRLNNSSFTAAQWAAISSGITAAKVAQYDAGVTPANVVESGNMNAVTSNAVANSLSYSTEEVNTGKKWIDGKPIYRIVTTATKNQQVDTTAYKNTGAPLPSNVDKYILIRSTQNTANAFYYSTTNATLYIAAVTTMNALSGTNYILEYTKTTD
jgi:hypothetical protein